MNTVCKGILLAPDKFKGSLSADRFCTIAEEVLREIYGDIPIFCCPMADGGEGSLDCFVRSTGAEIFEGEFINSDKRKIRARYALQGKTAFIEMAQTAGLVNTTVKNPCVTTTYGVGEQIADAIRNGAEKIYLSMGGSSTNDAGCGMAAALGYTFLNGNGEAFLPTGGTLGEIAEIRFPATPLPVTVTALCDVQNPLYGKDGAAYVYAEQKGADKNEIALLDENLQKFNALCKEHGYDFSAFPGAGAAGGMGAGATLFLKATLKSGTASFMEIAHLDKILPLVDTVISGEGKLDAQSEFGKVVCTLYEQCRGKRFVAFCGVSELQSPSFDVVSINKPNETLKESLRNTEQNLKDALRAYFGA